MLDYKRSSRCGESPCYDSIPQNPRGRPAPSRHLRQYVSSSFLFGGEGIDCKGTRERGDYHRYLQIPQGKLAYVIQMDPDNIKLRTAQLMLAAKMGQCEIPRETGFMYDNGYGS